MKSTESPLLPMLRSRVQGDMLATLFLSPEDSFSLTDVATRIGASVRAVHAEANRLVKAGWIDEQRRGNLRLLQANRDTVIARPLTDLLLVTYGPLPVLTEALRGVPGIEHAFIYGSWAARHEGVAGGIPRDVDLLIVGDADPDDLAETLRGAEQKLGREINIRRVRPDRWSDPGDDPFLTAIRQRPIVELRLDGDLR